MEKRKTPVSTVLFYIIGIILLIVSAFMLWTAVNYTKTYLTTYDASFKDMWTNSVQYIITQFLPYCGMGVICLGLGRAIKGTAPLKTPKTDDTATGGEAKATEPETTKDADAADDAAAVKAAAGTEEAEISDDQLKELIRRIDTNREVLSIKIEEKEKRDSFRIKELEKTVEGFLSDVKYINEPLEELVYKQAAGIEEDAAEAEAETAQAPAGPVPQIFTVSRRMTAPACPAAETAAAEEPAPASAGAVPQIFTVSRRMTAPACPAAETAAAEEPAPAAAGAVPQIFTVSRRMTAPACPAAEK